MEQYILLKGMYIIRGGFRGGGGGGVQGVLSYIKNDVMSTVIYAAFCMLPSLDFARLHIVLAKRGLY